jgi:archaemetzincin
MWTRRDLLLFGASELGALACAGCATRVEARPAPDRRAVAGPSASSAAAPSPVADGNRAPHPTLPLGTEVAFDANDRAFFPDRDQFEDKRPPGPGDWMVAHPETGMNFEQYRTTRAPGRTGTRTAIILQPLGYLDAHARGLMKKLAAFTSAYFDIHVRVSPSLGLGSRGRRTRSDGERHWVQYHTGTLIDRVLAPRLPSDAVAMLGITLSDLYPEPSWNFVFGEASLDARVGVYSLNRYFPKNPARGSADEERLGLFRSFKVLAHETGHMFGLVHCKRYECVMNGSNSLDEMDKAPLNLCAVCLKMLAYNLRFDVRSRYRRLLPIYEQNGLAEPARWIRQRLARIEKSVPARSPAAPD